MHVDAAVRQLSLKARLALALICFERYCHQHRLTAPDIARLLHYLWDFPCIEGSSSFQAWERQQPALVTVGLGGDMPPTYGVWLQHAGIPSSTFRQLVESTVEIIYWSLYGAVDDDATHGFLRQVVTLTEQQESIPILLPHFAHSRFADAQGWGHPLTEQERDAWRALGNANPS